MTRDSPLDSGRPSPGLWPGHSPGLMVAGTAIPASPARREGGMPAESLSPSGPGVPPIAAGDAILARGGRPVAGKNRISNLYMPIRAARVPRSVPTQRLLIEFELSI